jgi:hypothetical protein
MSTEFTPAGYRSLISTLCEHGYQARPYSDIDPESKHVLLRHDIDISVEAAHRIASIEAGFGLSATYFILLTSELYNPLSLDARSLLRDIHNMGHWIGLHFDAASVQGDADVLEHEAIRQCEILETALSSRIDVVSHHRPAPNIQGNPKAVAGRIHAYQPKFFSEIGYCSDSGGRWRHSHPFDHPSFLAGKALQLVTHPVWWIASAGESVRTKLDRLAARRFDRIRAEIAMNCKTYPQEFRQLMPEAMPPLDTTDSAKNHSS